MTGRFAFRRALFAALTALSIGGFAAAQAERDGSSIDTAIVVTAADEIAGIAAEREWTRKNYPGWRWAGQSLLHDKGRPYDRIQLISPDGTAKIIYFDITAFYGKM